MELIIANGRMVSFDSRRNGSSSHQFCGSSAHVFRLLMPHKPGYAVLLNMKGFKMVRSRTLCSGEKGAQSLTEELVEKELKFRPMFRDYLKVMESVQIDRSKCSSEDADMGSSEKGSSRNSDWSVKKEKILVARRGDGDLNDSRGYENHRLVHHEGSHGTRRDSLGGFSEEDNVGRSGNQTIGRLDNRKVERNFRRQRGHQSSSDGENGNNSDMEKGKAKYFSNGAKTQKDKSQNGKYQTVIENFSVLDNGKDASSFFGVQMKSMQRSISKERVMTHIENSRIQESNDQAIVAKGKNVCKNKLIQKVDEHRTGDRSSQYNSEGKWGEAGFDRRILLNDNGEKRMYEPEIRGSSLRREGYDGRKTRIRSRSCETGILEMGSNMNGQILHADYSKRFHDGSEKATEKWTRSLNLRGCSGNQRQIRLQEDTTDSHFASKTVEAGGKFGEVVDSEDRAAFKTFEVFTDVRNRPRVLRMEMEESIRNLAKWLNATDVNIPEWQFSRMMHNVKIKFTDHSILRVIQILGEFGNWRRVLQVVEWFQSRERFKSYKSKYIYTAVLDVLGKAKRPMEALNIFYAMRKERASYPDLAAYHCISVTLGQAGLMKELFDVMDCMRVAPKRKLNVGLDQKWDPRLEPDLVVYNAVLNACVQQKQWEGAFWVLQQLKQHCLRPSSATYGLVMEVMLACGKYNLVHEFFKKAEKASIPSTLSYKVLVNAFWREGKIDEAMLAVQDMERRGIVGSASLYYDLARCLCSAGRCQEALLQIDKVCKVAKKPLVVTYTGLIQACLDSGSIQNGVYIFNEMHRFCAPNIVTCNIMLKSYIENGMYEEAKDLFQKILDGSKDIKSKSDLRIKVVPDKFTFNTMMEASVAAENWDDFENVYVQMLHHGYHFDKKRHLRMIMDAARAGKGRALDETWEYLASSGRNLPPPIIKEKLCMKLKEDDCTTAISFLNVQQSDELHAFTAESWLNLLKFNSNSFKKDTIVRLAHDIKPLIEESGQRSPLLQTLLKACITFLGPASLLSDHQVLSTD